VCASRHDRLTPVRFNTASPPPSRYFSLSFAEKGVDFQNLFVLLKRGKKNRITKGRYKSLQVAKEDGAVTVNVGVFLNSVINFVALSVIIFVMVRTLEKFKQQGKKHKQTRKCCPECFMKIDQRALRCPYCTSDVTLSEPHLVEGTDTVTESDAFQKGMKPKKLMKKQLSRELGWKT
jgi:large-conductance mechanosensitive channel